MPHRTRGAFRSCKNTGGADGLPVLASNGLNASGAMVETFFREFNALGSLRLGIVLCPQWVYPCPLWEFLKSVSYLTGFQRRSTPNHDFAITFRFSL